MNEQRKNRNNSRKVAAALQYRHNEDTAPRLTAKGSGIIAENIIKAAREAGIPIHEDSDLVSLLMTLHIGDVIPPEMYTVVSELLAFIYRINNKMPAR